MKKVSIIISCFNSEKYIEEAINSALNQTYQNIEIVIIDDGSSDSSKEIIKKYSDKYNNINFIDNKENKGVCYTRNMAIEVSNGELILPLDSDDTIDKTYVEKAVKVLDDNKDADVVFSGYKVFGDKNYIVYPDFNEKTIIFESCISVSSLFRKEDFIKVGGFNLKLNRLGAEDWELWIRFVKNGFKFYRINEPLLNYRIIKNKISRNCYDDNVREKIYTELIKNNVELYLNNKEAIKRVLDPRQSEYYKNTYIRINKYKKRYQLLLYLAIFEALVILALILKIIF